MATPQKQTGHIDNIPHASAVTTEVVQGVPDVAALMADIRARVTKELAGRKDPRPAFKPKTPERDSGCERKAGELLHSEDLRQLNLQHSYALRLNPAQITSHRGGVVGKVIEKLKRKFLVLLRDSILRSYFQEQHQFNSILVRYLNDLTRYMDARDGAQFWELVRKIDVDTTKALDRIEQISDEQNANLRMTERGLHESINGAQQRITQALEASSHTAQQLQSLESAVKGLEHIVSNFNPASIAAARGGASGSEQKVEDRTYLIFENRFRGSERLIAERLGIYPVIFKGQPLPVLEIGAGRGELQRLFSEAGVKSYGVDTDEGMVQASTARGFDVRLEDGIQHLRNLPDRSLGGVIAVQVIEHLPFAVLREFIALASAKIATGGKLIFETINPTSVVALSSNYYRDPTHVAPLHPDTMKFILEMAGFIPTEVHLLSPIPDEAKLQPMPVSELMSPRWVEVVERFNRTISQLNGLLYGPQDFCVIGTRGAEAAQR